MFTINIIIGNKSNAVSISSGHTPRQILGYLRQNRQVPQFQSNFYLQFNGDILPFDVPVGNYGVGPSDTLQVVSQQPQGFGGGGKESFLETVLNAFKKLK